MALRALIWLSGVTPAQQDASTAMGTSGKKDLRTRALEITQISVHSPMSTTSAMGSALFRRTSSSARS